MTRWFIFLTLLLSACSAATSQPTFEATSAPDQAPTAHEITPIPETPPPLTTTPDESVPNHTPTASPDLEPHSVTQLPDASNSAWTLLANDFQKPLDITHAGDDRLFVV